MESLDYKITRRNSNSERLTIKIEEISPVKEDIELESSSTAASTPEKVAPLPIPRPKKLPMLGIVVSITMYFIAGLFILAISDMDELIIAGFIYLVMLLGTLIITLLGMQNSSKLRACMFFTYTLWFLVQSFLLLVNIIHFLANNDDLLLALLMYNTTGFIIFTVGTSFANYYYRQAKVVEQFPGVP